MALTRQDTIKFYVKLVLGTICFFAFLYYTHVEITDPSIVVDRWVFVMLIAVMGSLLGVDMLDQWRGTNDGSEDNPDAQADPTIPPTPPEWWPPDPADYPPDANGPTSTPEDTTTGRSSSDESESE